MDFTNGNDRILFIKINGIYTPIGCLTGSSISESSEMIDTTTKDNKGWSTSRPSNQNYSISFDGIQVNSTMAGGNFNLASYDRLKLIKRKKTLIEWKLEGYYFPIVDFGKGYITELSSIENVDEFMTFNGSIVGYGEPKVQSLGGIVLNTGDPKDLLITENNLIRIE